LKPNYPKLGLASLFALYFLWIAYDPMQGSFLDNVNLAIHESGHLIFRILGEFAGIAGGSLFQVILPLAFVGYFGSEVIIRRRSCSSGSVKAFSMFTSMRLTP